MKKQYKKTQKRLVFSLAIIFLIAILILARLTFLLIVKGKQLEREALQQWTKSNDIKPERGLIYDRTGKKLAININGYSVWAYPKNIEDAHKTALELAEVLYMDEEVVYEKITKDKNNEKLKQWIDREDAEKIRSLGLKGIKLEEENKRFYPNGNFASHILGFTNIDNVGLEGVEKTFNKELSGIPGRWLKMADAYKQQMPYGGEKIHDATNGYSLKLTIDEHIQGYTEKVIEKALEENQAKNVSVIVMDPNTGDILAMATKPDYNPNTPRDPINDSQRKEWSTLSDEELKLKWYEQWRNFAVNDVYEPGSTFKLITAAAALEENVTNPNVTYVCHGAVTDIPGETLRCASRVPHGQITFKRGLEDSCNVVFVNVGRQLGRTNMHKYAKAFGFGEKTYIDLLGEELGLLPPPPEVMKEVELATMSYGHGIAVTPIQLISATSAIVNGGELLKPQILKEVIDEEGNLVRKVEPELKRRVISEQTSKTMLSLMETSVTDGSGKRAKVPGYRVGGKTGTAQKIVNGRYLDGKFIASFIGAGPIEDPQLVVLAIVDEPMLGKHYGGTSAAPIVKEILEDSFKYLNIQPSNPVDIEESTELVDVPDVKGLKLEEAGKKLTEFGFKYSVNNLIQLENVVVESQYPEAWSTVPYGSIIDLTLKVDNSEDRKMPDLIGMTREESIKILNKLNVEYKLEGTGNKVVEQYPLPNKNLDKSEEEEEIILKMK